MLRLVAPPGYGLHGVRAASAATITAVYAAHHPIGFLTCGGSSRKTSTLWIFFLVNLERARILYLPREQTGAACRLRLARGVVDQTPSQAMKPTGSKICLIRSSESAYRKTTSLQGFSGFVLGQVKQAEGWPAAGVSCAWLGLIDVSRLYDLSRSRAKHRFASLRCSNELLSGRDATSQPHMLAKPLSREAQGYLTLANTASPGPSQFHHFFPNTLHRLHPPSSLRLESFFCSERHDSRTRYNTTVVRGRQREFRLRETLITPFIPRPG